MEDDTSGPSLQVSSVGKEGPSYPFRLFQCSLVAGSKPFLAAYMAVILSLN